MATKDRIRQFGKDHKFVEQNRRVLASRLGQSLFYLHLNDKRFEVLLFPRMLTDWEYTRTALERLGLSLPDNAKEIWDDLIDLDRVHYGLQTD